MMNAPRVALIAFEQFDNLGAGYLASALTAYGYQAEIIRFTDSGKTILDRLKEMKPLIAGFSIIFQYHIREFRDLISYLREEGIGCHFTAGGYYASLKYRELLEFIPALDSVVRFEGEHTLTELVRSLSSGLDVANINGLVYRNNSKIIANPLRPPEMDLDNFPFPVRQTPDQYALGRKYATLIAGRGCAHNCSFCNNIVYNRESGGPVRRTRSPAKVAGEIEYLVSETGCNIFLFQDDDFPVKTGKGADWVASFCNELRSRNLARKIMWKINCRPDEIDPVKFRLMKDHGLFLVFIGIDDGTDSGLRNLNKKMTVSQTIAGITVLKSLDIGFDFGFMLFQPGTTFSGLAENLDFLATICGDGYTPLTFLKLMPYFETRVEKTLRKEGRLKGMPGLLDYDFRGRELNDYYNFVTVCFSDWIKEPDGLVNISRWARNYSHVFSFYYGPTPLFYKAAGKIRDTISASNLFMISKMKELAGIFSSGRYDPSCESLVSHREEIRAKHNIFCREINESIEMICRMGLCQK